MATRRGEADLKCHHRIAPAPRLLSLQDRLFHKLSAKCSEQLVLSNKEHSWVFFVCVCVGGILLAFPPPLGDLYSARNGGRLKRKKKKPQEVYLTQNRPAVSADPVVDSPKIRNRADA